MYVLSIECNDCGWDWLGTFAYCPNCRRSNVKIINYETVEEFDERLELMELRETSRYFLTEDF